MSFLRHIAASVFLILSLQVIIPAQLWHGLCEHEDTVDCCSNNGETTVSVHHEHCLVLDLSLPAIEHENEEMQFPPQQVFITLSDFVRVQTFGVVRTNSVIRGPPVLS